MTRFLPLIKTTWRDPRVRELLLFCLPALLAGFMLRAVLMSQLPYGFFHDDTPDYLTTPEKLLTAHKFELHMKKTFLAPVFMAVPFVLHIPALIFIAAVQHLLGLVLIVMIGLLCRLWFAHWKWFIVPATLFVAVNPAILWYEHVLLAEFLYAFTVVLLAIAGTFYARSQTRGRLIFLLAALVLVAGARPEGKLLFGFGFLLVALAHCGEWRRLFRIEGIVLAVAIVTHLITKTSQAGLLLYTSVAYMSPPHLAAAPGLEEYLGPVQQEFQAKWASDLQFAKAHQRDQVTDAIRLYFEAHPDAKQRLSPHADQKLCNKLAKATLLRNPIAALELAGLKFRYTATVPTNDDFTELWLYKKQIESMRKKADQIAKLGSGLTGAPLRSANEIDAWVRSHEHPERLDWFAKFSDRWHSMLQPRLADLVVGKRHVPGLAWFYIVAWTGMALVVLRRGRMQKLHFALSLTLVALLFTITLTANVKPRFRFVFEPFWGLYILLILDCALFWLAPLWQRQPKIAPVLPNGRPSV